MTETRDLTAASDAQDRAVTAVDELTGKIARLTKELEEANRKGEELCVWIGPLLTHLRVSTPADAIAKVEALEKELEEARASAELNKRLADGFSVAMHGAEDELDARKDVTRSASQLAIQYKREVDDLRSRLSEVEKERDALKARIVRELEDARSDKRMLAADFESCRKRAEEAEKRVATLTRVVDGFTRRGYAS